MKNILCTILLLILTACSGSPKKPLEPPVTRVVGEDIDYVQDDKSFKGYMVHDAEKDHKRPGILLIHHWVGLDDFTRNQADEFAKAGYIVFAMDMYGVDVTVSSHEDAAAISGFYRDNRDLMRSRIERAIQILRENPYVDPDNLAVVGYCFGGDALIDYMLYSDDFAAGISFHGFYTSPLIDNDLKGSLQIHHGEIDPVSTMESLTTFTRIHTDTETYVYDGVGHSYTDPESRDYDRVAATLSIERAKSFLKRKLPFRGYREFLDYSIEIEATPEEVFSYLSDPEKNMLWIKGLYEEESLYKEEGTYLNSRFLQRIRSFGMDMEFLGVITSYSPPDYLEMYYSDSRFIIKLDYILEATEDGTLLTHKAYATDSGTITNFFNKRILKGQIKDLRKVVESGSK